MGQGVANKIRNLAETAKGGSASDAARDELDGGGRADSVIALQGEGEPVAVAGNLKGRGMHQAGKIEARRGRRCRRLRLGSIRLHKVEGAREVVPERLETGRGIGAAGCFTRK